jgi:hypothetical protein
LLGRKTPPSIGFKLLAFRLRQDKRRHVAETIVHALLPKFLERMSAACPKLDL